MTLRNSNYLWRECLKRTGALTVGVNRILCEHICCGRFSAICLRPSLYDSTDFYKTLRFLKKEQILTIFHTILS